MFLLAHVTDVHLGPLPPVRRRDLVSKRGLGYVNWQRNRVHAFDDDVLAALVEDLHAHKPDHIAVTGDLVNLALSEEFVAARDWLESLGNPEDVSVVPGNHDAYVAGGYNELLRVWRDFMTDDDQPGGPAHFPFLRRRGPIGLIGLSSAIPTGPFMATGRISTDQTAALGRQLIELGQENRFRVVLVHHPPVDGVASWPRRLIGAGLFRAEIAEYGAELVLHGHNHRIHVTEILSGDRAVPVVGAAAASTAPRTARPGGSYNLYSISGTAGAFTCTMTERGIRRLGGPVETLSERNLSGAASG
jgi:3',5'-cyclic AMP phosphodiesterase CpdA